MKARWAGGLALLLCQMFATSGCTMRRAGDTAALGRADQAAFQARTEPSATVTTSREPLIKAQPVEYQEPRRGGVSVRVVDAPLGGVLAGICRARGYALSFVGSGKAEARLSMDIANQPFAKAVRDIALAAGLVAVIDERRQHVVITDEATYFFRVPPYLAERTSSQYSVQSNPGLPTPSGGGGGGGGGSGSGGSVGGSGGGSGSSATGANAVISGGSTRNAEALVAALIGVIGAQGAAGQQRVQFVPESALVSVRSNALGLRRAYDLMDTVARESQQQIEVQAALVEVSLTRELQYGIDWERVIPVGRLLGDGASLALTVAGRPISAPALQANVTTQSLRGVITALQNVTDVRVVAQPSAITRNHVDAVLYRGRQVPYLAEVSTTTTANVGATSSARVAYVPEGTSIALRASVLDGQRVDLRIAPQQIQGIELRTFNFGNNGTLQAPTFPLAQALLQLVVEPGRTYVIGGLNLESELRDDLGVPLLADVPLLGALFGDARRTTQRSQLVMLLTARILPSPAVVDSLLSASL